MTDSDSSLPRAALERHVLERVRRELGLREGAVLDESVVEAARDALYHEELFPDEEQRVEATALETEADVLGEVLGLRIERALRAALGQNARQETAVFVLRGTAAGSRAQADRRLVEALRALQEARRSKTEGAAPRVWFLAAKDVFGKLCQMLAHKAGDGPATIVFEDGTHQGAAPEELPPVEIVETAVIHPGLEARATRRVEEVRTASLAALEQEQGAGADVSTPEVPAAAPAPPELEVDSDPLLGSLFHQKYRIVRRIGRGGFGAVYEALDERGAGNRVAIKVLFGAAAESAAQLQAFKDEARRVTRLSHPNIVDWKVFDEDEEGTPYFVMELVQGEEFDETLRREGKLEPMRAARLLLQVLDALRAAHHLSASESILHLDLKPSNLFLVPARHGQEEQLKVIDFGIGQYIGDETADDDAAPEEPATAAAAHEDELDLGPSTLTFGRYPTRSARGGVHRSTGCTPEYASPEQCAHVMQEPDIRPLDGRSDLYSLGVMGFQMLTGRLPFECAPGERLSLLTLHREQPAPGLAAAGAKVPKQLARFLERCLRKDPDERFATTREAHDFLDQLVHPPVWRAIARVTVPLVLLFLLVGGWAWTQRGQVVPRAVLTTEAGARVDAQPLYLGPERPRVALAVATDESTEDAGWSVARVEDGAPLVDWNASPLPDGRVELAAPVELTGRTEERVELVAADGRLRSVPFTVVWVGPETWTLSAAEIAGEDALALDARAVDPAGLALDVWIAGEARADLAEVSVAVAGGAPLRLPRGQSADDRDRYRLELAELGLADGDHELELAVRDRAGAEWRRTLPVRCESRSLAFEAATLESCNRIGGRFVVSPRSDPELRVELTRAADLRWQVVVADEVALFGDSGGRKSASVALPDLYGLAGGKPYSGTLRLEADDSLVLHAAGSARGSATRELLFSFDPAEPEFSASWRSGGEERELDDAADGPLYTNAAEAELVISRLQAVPMVVEAAWWPAGREAEVRSVRSEDFQNPQVSQVSLPITLEDDGEYELRLRAYRYDTATRAAAESPDVERAQRVVLDRVAPAVALGTLTAGLVVEGEADVPEELSLALGDDEIELELRLAAEGRAAVTGSSGGGVPLAALWREAGASDGTYELTVIGHDRAGNASAPALASFVVAKTPPEVVLQQPTGRGKWYPDATSGEWTLRLAVEDPNGVAEASCELRLDDDRGGRSWPFRLERDPLGTGAEAVFVGRAPLPAELSERDVRLRVDARDEHGMQRVWTSDRLELPTILRKRPEQVSVSRDGVGLGTLRLVRGNEGFAYLFGGRGDVIENAAYGAAGLEPFNAAPRRSRQRSWQVELPPGAIGDYYLDEREVSVGQFLAFVEATDCPLDEAARERHRARLDGLDAELPVTEVTWDEASAFARWAGKRLPSLVQWEYAVRGGAAYRPYAAWVEDAAATSFASELVPCGGGADWTPDTGIADLGGNAAEWTTTPAGFRAMDGEYPHEWARRRREDLLTPALDGDEARFWVAGASFASHRRDFTVADFRDRGDRVSQVGFRCGATLEDVQDAIARVAAPGEPSFRESTGEDR